MEEILTKCGRFSKGTGIGTGIFVGNSAEISEKLFDEFSKQPTNIGLTYPEDVSKETPTEISEGTS